jgi:hypothetical protein
VSRYKLISSRFPCIPFRHKWSNCGYNLRGTADVVFGVYDPRLVSQHWYSIYKCWHNDTWLDEVYKYYRLLRNIHVSLNF